MPKLIVLHQGAIGDFLLTLPVVQAARSALHADFVTAIATAPSARLAAGRSAVDLWLSPEELGLYRLFSSDLPLSDRMTELLAGAEAVLNFLCGPTERIDQRIKSIAGGHVVSVDPRPTPETRELRRHIALQWTHDIRQSGWPVAEPGAARIRMENRSPHRPARVLIHPGSGGRGKCWPLERFTALVDLLADLDVTWMLGPAELTMAKRLQDRDESLLVEEDLCKAAEQMAGFDLYIGNDSGMTHLAAAIGLPTLAVFGATDPSIWRPLGEHVTIIAPDSAEVDMESIPLEQVHSAVRQHSAIRRP